MNAFDLQADYPGFRLAAAGSWSASCTALFGASGSGKTTILEAIAGLRADVRGSVTLGGARLDGLTPRARRVGWVPQDASLFPHLDVARNLAFGARDDRALLEQTIDALELRPLLARRPAELSGGERQRVALGRAIAARPRALLLDEPLAAIDRPLRVRLVPFLRRVSETALVPTLLVSHDPLEVIALATHVLVLDAGRVVAEGDPRAVFRSPETFGSLVAATAENVFDVKSAVADESGTLQVTTRGGARIVMVHVPGFPLPARIALRAEDIVLALGTPAGVSTQNVLAGTVQDVSLAGAQATVRVRIDGEVFLARVTGRAARALELAPGKPITLLIKAHSFVAMS